jgi:apolipoprotein N-acyltransferase
VYFVGTIYWITRVMVVYGDLNIFVAALINAGLIAYLALFPALFAVVIRRLWMSYGDRSLAAVPFVWVATELGRTQVFPWVLLGYSQTPILPIAQIASVVGVYGLSGLVAAGGSALAVAALAGAGRRSAASRGTPSRTATLLAWPYPWIIGVAATVVVVAWWGSARLKDAALTRRGTPVRIGLIQGNVDQAQKWDQARAATIFTDYLRLSRDAIAQGAQLVIWPESSTPFRFEGSVLETGEVRALARDSGVPILLGSDQIEAGNPPKIYNSAFLVRSDGSTGGVYRKMHLVPFGEYVPLKRLLFFASPLVEAVSDFSAGESAALLPVDHHQVSTAICYEIVYPDLVRQFVAGGSQLITTITNDAWFGRTPAPYQHFAQASMRAIEDGRYLVRSANTGISGIVDPYGHVLTESQLFVPAVIVGEARYLSELTFYARYGDVFAYASAIFVVILLVQVMITR